MKNVYFSKSKREIQKRFGIDLVEEILFNRADRVILYSDDPIESKNIELKVILGSLSSIQLGERESITTDELFSYFEYENEYAYVAGKSEYYEYITSHFFEKSDYTEETFPIKIGGKRIWLSVEITRYKEYPNLIIYQFKDHTELMNEEEQRWLRTHTDSLTGLFNKFTLDYHYSLRYMRDNLHVIYLDIDNFKNVNDSYGHHVGDYTLIEFSKILKSHESKYNHFYRVGGDEFVGLFYEDEDYVRGVVENILSRIKTIENQNDDTKPTVSIGVVKGTARIDLIRKADVILYKVKREGKDGYLYETEKA